MIYPNPWKWDFLRLFFCAETVTRGFRPLLTVS
jgi:hypothetical protein